MFIYKSQPLKADHPLHFQKWGYEVKYKEAATLPNLSIKNFALETPDGRKPGKKWKDVPFTVDEFSFEEYCENNPDLLDDDGDDTD